MFDTVLFRQAYDCPTPPRAVLANFICRGDRYTLELPRARGLAQPQLTWRTAVYRLSYLEALVSLPKLLFGNNVALTKEAEVQHACDIISKFASSHFGVPFDAATAIIGRLDVCWNWSLTEAECSARLYALRNISLKRLTRRVIGGGTVEWSSKSQKIIAYSKLAEVYKCLREGRATEADIRAAAGMFRLERSFMSSDACRRLARRLGLPDRRANHLLRSSVAERVLKEVMKKLCLDQPSEPIDGRLLRLRKKYGVTTKCEQLIGFLYLFDELGKEDMIHCGYSAETLRRRRKEIEAAGAWSANPTRHTLPPLRLVPTMRAEETLRITTSKYSAPTPQICGWERAVAE